MMLTSPTRDNQNLNKTLIPDLQFVTPCVTAVTGLSKVLRNLDGEIEVWLKYEESYIVDLDSPRTQDHRSRKSLLIGASKYVRLVYPECRSLVAALKDVMEGLSQESESIRQFKDAMDMVMFSCQRLVCWVERLRKQHADVLNKLAELKAVIDKTTCSVRASAIEAQQEFSRRRGRGRRFAWEAGGMYAAAVLGGGPIFTVAAIGLGVASYVTTKGARAVESQVRDLNTVRGEVRITDDATDSMILGLELVDGFLEQLEFSLSGFEELGRFARTIPDKKTWYKIVLRKREMKSEGEPPGMRLQYTIFRPQLSREVMKVIEACNAFSYTIEKDDFLSRIDNVNNVDSANRLLIDHMIE